MTMHKSELQPLHLHSKSKENKNVQTLHGGYSEDIIRKLMSSERVKAAVNVHSHEISQENARNRHGKNKRLSREQCERQAWTNARNIIDQMIAKMDSQRLLAVTAYSIETVLMKMYDHGIQIAHSEAQRLQQVAEEAARTKTPMLIVPSHKSHIDYLVVRLGLEIPHITAGDNLQIPLIGSLFRNAGAFFIRRAWGNDHLYNTIMREYIQLLLKEGHSIEVFIEGGRSRIGKLLQPKFGILKIVLDAVLSGVVKDVLIVPINIGYDKVIETSAYVDELLGGQKKKESLVQLLSNINLLSLKLGTIYVSVSEPFSMKQFIDHKMFVTLDWVNPRTTSISHDKNLILQSLGFKILGNINNVSIIMPTSLVGTILLTLRGRGVGKEELVRKVNWLRTTILKKGGRVVNFGSQTTFSVVEKATRVLQDMIGSQTNLLEFVYFPLRRFELSYYRNQVIHLFISESILSAALYSTIKAGGPTIEQKVLIYPNLIDDTSFLSSLLKYEFIFHAGGIQMNLLHTIEDMKRDNILDIEVDPGEAGQGALIPENNRKWVKLSDEERRIGRENFGLCSWIFLIVDFYCFLIWPFIETYWLASMCIISLIPENHSGNESETGVLPEGGWVNEKMFLARCQLFAKTLYYEGDMSYFESINKETLKNAFSRFLDMGVIIKTNQSDPPMKIDQTATLMDKNQSAPLKIALHPHWYPQHKMPSTFGDQRDKAPGLENEKEDSTSVWYYYKPTGRLWDLSEHISRFRREGKNRRDTSTVSSRVLRLCRQSCFWKFDSLKAPVYHGPKL